MQSSSTLCGMSFRKNLRLGQAAVIENVCDGQISSINVQLPTGYGKTFTSCCCYSVLRSQNRVNRLLYLVPTKAQLDQFVKDGKTDLLDAAVDDIGEGVIDVSYFQSVALKHHRNGTAHVFAITIQSLIGVAGREVVQELMASGRWMVVVDEYHHYGDSKAWGDAVSRLNASFVLAMSATPYRPKEDSAFGKPNVVVEYTTAAKEGAVKSLRLNSYIYRVDFVDTETKDVISYSPEELVEKVGSDNPDEIDRTIIENHMRWSPKYISPLVEIPIGRMLHYRAITGLPLQAIVGAMSCRHAEMVCEQVSAMFPELRVDWVGTGQYGRRSAENEEILKKFCPPKRGKDSKRHPDDVKLDVLVHVGMAGEGLDSVFVTEVIHCNSAGINNSNHQENGRAARIVPTAENLIGYINVDCSSSFAKYVGPKVMELMDNPDAAPTTGKEREEYEHEVGQLPEIPDEPYIPNWDIELVRVDAGDIEEAKNTVAFAFGKTDDELLDILADELHPDHDRITKAVQNLARKAKRNPGDDMDIKARTKMIHDQVNGLVSAVAGTALKKMYGGSRVDKTVAGDIKKRINTRKKRALGPIELDEGVLRKHWAWLKRLDDLLRQGEVPTWLR